MAPRGSRSSGRAPRHLAWSALSLMALAGPALGQVSHAGTPPSARFALSPTVATEVLPPLDAEAALAEDAARDGRGPARWGRAVEVDLGLDDAGQWETGPGGERVWRLGLVSEGALSMSLVFSRWVVPEGGEFYVRSASGAMTLGAFGAKNVRADREFATQPVAGEHLYLEYVEPHGTEPGALPEMRISHVIRGYRDVLGAKAAAVAGGSAGCNVDVNCPEGDEWQVEKRSVAKILLFEAICTGALLNNTAQDERRLFLTAQHCLGGGLNNWVFLFNDEAYHCDGSIVLSEDSVVGASLLQQHVGFDFALLELHDEIPDDYGVTYAGWNATNDWPQTGTGIHHPNGDVKKISLDLDPLNPTGPFWRVEKWEVGITQPGSSGSPLFDQDHYLVGQLCCGEGTCTTPFYEDFYSQYHKAHSAGVAAFTDPLGLGVKRLASLDTGYEPPGPPRILSVEPPALPALVPGTAETITVRGKGFEFVTEVAVDGQPIGFPETYTIVDDGTLTFEMPLLDRLGRVSIHLTSLFGEGEKTVEVVPPDPPALQLGDGVEPVSLTSVTPTRLLGAGQPGHPLLFFASPVLAPSSVHGVPLDIGADLAALHLLRIAPVGPAGWVDFELFLALDLPLGSPVYFQALELDPSSAGVAASATQVATGTWLF